MSLLMFILGSIFGSFYLVLGTRLPKGEDVLFSRSRCDSCKATLKWYHLIPIVSYVFLLGKCSKCKKRISILNPIVEISTGLLFWYSYFRYGISYEFFTCLIISSLLILIFISDFKYLIILDSPLVGSSILVLALKWIYFGHVAACKAFLAGLFMFLAMYLVSILGRKMFNREALGGGDIKLAGVIGIILGVKLGLCALILSAFLALPISLATVMATKNNEVPYGPFMVGSLFVIFIFMTKFINLLNLLFNVL